MLNHNRESVTSATPADAANEQPPAAAKITPTQDLIIGELGARRRTGEPFWPFARAHTKALRGLQEMGLIEWWDASYGNHNVRLTAAGEKLAFDSSTYSSPLEKELAKVKTRLAILTEPSDYRPFVHPDIRGRDVPHDVVVAMNALNSAADAIQALHPGEKKASVEFLRERAANLTERDIR